MTGSSKPRVPPDEPLLSWRVVFLFWAVFWALLAMIRLVFTYYVAPPGRYPAPAYGLFNDGVQAVQWALLTPVIVRLAGRLPITRATWYHRVPLHFVIGVGMVLGTSLVMVAASWPLYPPDGRFPWTILRVGEMLLSYGTPLFLLLYAGILALGFALHTQRALQAQQVAAATVERQLTEARLHALRLQLHPHFLHNTLNTIAHLTESDPPHARRMIARLGALLRRTIDSAHEQEAPLEEELRFVRQYLEIAQARFGDRLTTVVTVAPETGEALVPVMLLQPLVENALEHGISRVAGRGTLEIHSSIADGVLRIRVQNSGRGSATEAPGVGLANTRARLEQLYGDAAGLELHERADGTVVADVRLPLHTRDDLRAPASLVEHPS